MWPLMAWAEVAEWTPWERMVSAQDVRRVGDHGVNQRRKARRVRGPAEVGR